MSDHNSAVFNNSCLRVPRNPVNKRPFPVYDQKYINQLENQARKLSLESDEFAMKVKQRSPDIDKSTLKSFIEFYDSIPEYDDVNHLSSKEFYRRLEMLKEKQRSYYDYIQNEVKYDNKHMDWIDDYKNLTIGDKKCESSKKRKSTIKPFCATPILNKHPKNEDMDWMVSSDKEKPPSRRSVRIESPSEKLSSEVTPELDFFRSKSRANVSSAGSKGFNTFNDSSPWEDLSVDDFKLDSYREPGSLTTRSAPNSPSKTKLSVGWKDCGITIPKPFQMTVRDEENRIVDEIITTTKKPEVDEKQEMFRAHPVPIESQIPLFDQIMSEQEKRRQKVKRRSKANLKAQMRPFSFTRRDEEIQAINKRLSKSSPCIFLDDPPMKIKPFKAKPIPKNLFSNYIYKKMHEDEFYRALQKKIRAEEMLKAASLPPSMAKREKRKPKCSICPRSFRDMDLNEEDFDRKPRRSRNDYNALEKELEELEKLEDDFMRNSPKLYKSKNRKKSKRGRQTSAESKSTMRSNSTLDSVNRSNLAAVLRIQSARKRLEIEMCKRLEEAKLREEARWKEKVMRKRPVWQSLAYSHEEDLAMRLQLRRDEERLRNEEHRHRMQVMLGRVKQQPTLFERQSQAKNAKTREELITKLYKDIGRYSASPKLSISDSSDKPSVVETKDEAIQAKFDEMFKEEEDFAFRGDVNEEEEGKCDCNCDDRRI